MNHYTQQGFTLVELTVTVVIFVLLSITVSSIGQSVFKTQTEVTSTIKILDQSRKLFQPIMDEVRAMQYPPTGSYPLVTAEEKKIVFYINIFLDDANPDGEPGRVTYEIDPVEHSLARTEELAEFIVGTGYVFPPDAGTTTTTTLIADLDDTQSSFAYYGEGYTGTEDPLDYGTLQSTTAPVRVVKLNITLADPNLAVESQSLMLTGTVSPRIIGFTGL